ncbi:zinc dependent phospholipase C family protein [Nitrosospira briensis]|uniref:Zinc dependent phospholipase C n=1 Tax=Nitrosospira briensis TaxID=35799 RepID=A0A1I4Z8L7_9PROT|nr:zinc dependent phospholipase C family protein [Nitrosospira briensis]SFN46625.1 Zinc dependent phospholipase C [Nitrosospira briensis]SFO23937.1 Zinc dependent phospholipase C [Nitrosospira briensis]
MSGAYAHLTMVNLAKEPARLEKQGFTPEAIISVLDYFRFCELGAVSPDYPYLDIAHPNACHWADRMHYQKTGDMVKAGIELIRKLDGVPQRKAFAWLLGYTSHVVTDTTIHPVVELKVGEYQKNKDKHRICEMHQDAYIFQRLNLGEIGLAEHLDSGIWGCCDKPDSGKLDPVITSTWQSMLETCYASAYQTDPPVIDNWHGSFKFVVDKAEEGNALPPFARHVAVNIGLTYPAVANLDTQYLEELATPLGAMSYDQIFDRAMQNVLIAWSYIADAVFKNNDIYRTAAVDWNLDTGRDATGSYVYWKDKA